MIWLSIDPGLEGTGLAIWEGLEANRPLKTMALKFKTKEEYLKSLNRILSEYMITYVLCEDTILFQGSARGHASASTGKLFKLSRFIGAIEDLCNRLMIKFELIAPNKWKGQLPKDVACSRIKVLCPFIPDKPHHLIDAVGIGLYRMGKF